PHTRVLQVPAAWHRAARQRNVRSEPVHSRCCIPRLFPSNGRVPLTYVSNHFEAFDSVQLSDSILPAERKEVGRQLGPATVRERMEVDTFGLYVLTKAHVAELLVGDDHAVGERVSDRSF